MRKSCSSSPKKRGLLHQHSGSSRKRDKWSESSRSRSTSQTSERNYVSKGKRIHDSKHESKSKSPRRQSRSNNYLKDSRNKNPSKNSRDYRMTGQKSRSKNLSNTPESQKLRRLSPIRGSTSQSNTFSPKIKGEHQKKRDASDSADFSKKNRKSISPIHKKRKVSVSSEHQHEKRGPSRKSDRESLSKCDRDEMNQKRKDYAGNKQTKSPSREQSSSPMSRDSQSLMGRRRSRSPVGRRRSRSPVGRRRSRSPMGRRRSRSPMMRRRERSPIRHERSPIGRRGRSPAGRYGRSPIGRYGRSPVGRYNQNSYGRYGRSPVDRYDHSPARGRNRSPVMRRSRSPVERRNRSPIRKSGRSPAAKLEKGMTRKRSSSSDSRQSPAMRDRSNSQIGESDYNGRSKPKSFSKSQELNGRKPAHVTERHRDVSSSKSYNNNIKRAASKDQYTEQHNHNKLEHSSKQEDPQRIKEMSQAYRSKETALPKTSPENTLDLKNSPELLQKLVDVRNISSQSKRRSLVSEIINTYLDENTFVYETSDGTRHSIDGLEKMFLSAEGKHSTVCRITTFDNENTMYCLEGETCNEKDGNFTLMVWSMGKKPQLLRYYKLDDQTKLLDAERKLDFKRLQSTKVWTIVKRYLLKKGVPSNADCFFHNVLSNAKETKDLN